MKTFPELLTIKMYVNEILELIGQFLAAVVLMRNDILNFMQYFPAFIVVFF